MSMVALGLLIEARSARLRWLYGGECAFILVGLLYTYSTASWLATAVGIVVFIVLLGSGSARAGVLGLAGAGFLAILALFPSEVSLLVTHASQSREVTLRVGLWETALNVIRAFPWTGVGFGLYTYPLRAEPYRVPAQYRPYAQPHNSYLELAAMGGLPVLALFVAILAFGLWLALRNRARLPARNRALYASAIAAVLTLSANALTINAWTLAPLATLGWLILGSVASPALTESSLVGDAERDTRDDAGMTRA
jgi:O-antigen ligase